MSLHLPDTNHSARASVDAAMEVVAAKGWDTYPSAKRSAIRYLATQTAARTVESVVMRANGNVQLIKFGPRGGAKVIWDFGNPLVTGA